MPTYKYRREDGTTFTIQQRITEDALDECPDTGQPVERVITGGMGFQLKGGGWYADGYGSSDASSSGQKSNASSNGETTSASSDGNNGGDGTAASDAKESESTKTEQTDDAT